MRNEALAIIGAVVAEHADRLPHDFALELDHDTWEALWMQPVKDARGKAIPRCPRLLLTPGVFRVTLSEHDTGDPQEAVH
jgi:hypothetical protein